MYLSGFDNIEDVRIAFKATEEQFEGIRIHCAIYDSGDYQGQCLVLFEKNGRLYVNEASHCSCYGLEDQWDGVETSRAALETEYHAKIGSTRYGEIYEKWTNFLEIFLGKKTQ